MLDRKDAERFLRKLKANQHPTLIYENYDGRLIPVREIVKYEETREGKTLVEIKFFLILRDDSWVSCKWTPYGWNRLSVSNYDTKDYPA